MSWMYSKANIYLLPYGELGIILIRSLHTLCALLNYLHNFLKIKYMRWIAYPKSNNYSMKLCYKDIRIMSYQVFKIDHDWSTVIELDYWTLLL